MNKIKSFFRNPEVATPIVVVAILGVFIMGSMVKTVLADRVPVISTTVTLTGNTLTKGSFLVGNDSNLSQATTSIFISSTGRVGIGSTTPASLLSVGNTTGINFSTATSTFNSTGGIQLMNGCYAIFDGTCLQTFIQNATAYKKAVDYATNAVLAGTPTYANGTAGVGATLTEIGFGALSVDGQAPTVGQRVLVKNEASQLTNGVYTVTVAGSGAALYVLTRATDYNTSADIYAGTTIPVLSGGTANGDTQWTETTTGTITMGSSNIVFEKTASGAALAALTATDSTLTFSGSYNGSTARTVGLNLSNATNWLAGFAIGTTTGTSYNGGLTLGSQKALAITEYQPATSTSMTINVLDGNKQLLRMGTAAFSIAFSNAVAGSGLRLKICNPNGTAGAVTFSDTKIIWGGGGAMPAQTTTANKCDTWYFDWSVGTSTGSLPTVIDASQNTF